MASFTVTSDTAEVIFQVNNLQYEIIEYDQFVFRIEQNGVELINEVLGGQGSISKSFTYKLYSEHIGANWLSPSCEYKAYVDCYFDGDCYTLGPKTINTNSISSPSSTISPTCYVPVREQVEDDCVAETLVCAMDLFRQKKTTQDSYEQFSAAYIYGSDKDDSISGMYTHVAIEKCKTYGSPRWEIHSGIFPDSLDKSEAISMFKSAEDIVKDSAKKQKFSKSEGVDFYDCASIEKCLSSGGYVVFAFTVPDNFYKIGTNGIVPPPDKNTKNVGHTMILMGLTDKKGTDGVVRKHWMAQNSWGEDWGNSGKCFIPYDWGCGVQGPEGFGTASWVRASYMVYGDDTQPKNPSVAYNLKITSVPQTTPQITLSWDSDESNASYVVLARKYGSDRWWKKITTSNTSAIIGLDKFDTYEFMIITIKNSYCSPQSEIITATPEKYIETIDDIITGLSFDIKTNDYGTGLKSMICFNVKTPYPNEMGVRIGITDAKGNIVEKEAARSTIIIDNSIPKTLYYNEEKSCFEFITETTYDYYDEFQFPLKLHLSGYVSYGDKEYEFSYNCYSTQIIYYPQIWDFEVWQDIIGTKEIEYYCRFYNAVLGRSRYELYASFNGNNPILKDSGIITSDYGGKTITLDDFGSYELILYIYTDDLWNVSYANLELLNLGKPHPWQWTQQYNLSTGGTGTLCAEAYVPADATGFHPITAVEWNNFTNRIEEVRRYKGGRDFGFTQVNGASNGHSSNPTKFTPALYNAAAEAIQVLGYNVPTISKGQELTAKLFLDLQNGLNNIINNLD